LVIVTVGLLFPFGVPGMVTAGSPDDFLTPAGRGLDGVARLLVDISTASYLCSGVLLETGRHILTAAHCVADASGRSDLIAADVLFETPDLISQVSGTRAVVHPDYNGDTLAGHDLAIIVLAGQAPAGADRYALYRAADEFGQVGLMAGYGATGRGRRDLTIPGEQRRAGRNRFESDGTNVGLDASGLLVYDFDNGRANNDGFGVLVPPLANRGEGAREVIPSLGDSGGPTFLGGAVAGIHSFGFRARTTSGRISDIDSLLNQSYGEFGADVRVSLYADWIEAVIAVPDLPTFFSVLIALICLPKTGSRWRTQRAAFSATKIISGDLSVNGDRSKLP
jgi:hypothetical protein